MDIKDKNGKTLLTTNSDSLSDADLTRANLFDANLTLANLAFANLTLAHLTDADLSYADLPNANLTLANLTDADLSYADLTRADLSDANLTNAKLAGAILTYDQLVSANLNEIKADLLSVLNENRNEVPYLRSAIVEGRINGSAYTGKCACLIGTLANAKHVGYAELSPDPKRPAERWFLAIQEGGTPKNNPISRITLGWVDGFLNAPK